MTTAHATLEIVAAYADGSLAEGMSLLVASHLTFCPECRQRVARLEALGGALLSDAAAEPMSGRCLARTLARLDAAEAAPDRAASPEAAASLDCALPAPIRERLGTCGGDIRWRFLLPGLAECRLDGFADEEVRLLRARPGMRILQHTHDGDEATLVLAGQMRDGARDFGPGDVALASETDEHRPQIVGSEPCICLVVLTGPMRFTGPVGRALNFFTG